MFWTNNTAADMFLNNTRNKEFFAILQRYYLEWLKQ